MEPEPGRPGITASPLSVFLSSNRTTLVRGDSRVSTVDSWDTDSWITYYSLTGLSRHADHHAFGARPYQELRVHDEAPRLPHGYLALFPLILTRNARFQQLMTAELERRQLGPFASG